ncbi:hypothetical protein Patl1_21432 [Pistacia atlantica]|uniref:Uncharacterized protein n=1 Tax=Pistacia atlantica TaxID=434234 RepID=A0ACC1BKZ8_9ROSI|nr:hypothetical protein Patl1_21432 [Pistacia atlantica]
MKKGEDEEEVMDKEEDKRREAAIRSIQSLQPNFKPKVLTKEQLSKFQELHRKRLQVKSKSKSKFHQKSKGTAYGTSKSHGKDLDSKDHVDTVSSTTIEYSNVPNLKSNGNNNSTLHQDNVAADSATKKRQKLFWGLDTKERWERKANM